MKRLSRSPNWINILFLTLTVFATVASAFAQTNAGIIRGTVKDPTGKVVPGVTVRLTNPINKYSQTNVTDREGVYQLIDVPFNRYKLTFDATGFGTTVQEIEIISNLVQQLDAQLKVGEIRQVVDVTPNDTLIDPEKTAPSVIIDRNQILNFPTGSPSRSTEEIIASAPGW